MAFDTDIIILGAGPGGATASLVLGKLGYRCILIDKASFPRDKICGDALSGKVVDILRKIDPALVDRLALDDRHLPCWGLQFISPAGDVLEVPFRLDYKQRSASERAPGYIARRQDFDHFLLNEALAQGNADFRPGLSIRHIERIDGGFSVSPSQGPALTCRLLIAADGAHSVAAKALAGRELEPVHHSAAVRGYYTGVADLHPDHFIELHYLRDLVPGYFWIFPLPGGRANVGLGLRSDVIAKRRLDLKKVFQQTIENHPEFKRRFAHAEPEGPLRGFGLPLGSRKRSLSGDGYLLVGDAASLIDPFTGEGIGNAMISGSWAAKQAVAALEAGRSDAAFLQAYDQNVYRQLGDELMLSYQLQRLAAYPRLFNFVVRKASRNPVLKETISCMFEDLDMRERLRKPSFYLKLLFARS
ncbi:MAG: geranylgeranyl reductase family protein [Bacteroidetes bacterium]|nr:geranylgeranyl reductase family protein [Bacteroidota bacterium]